MLLFQGFAYGKVGKLSDFEEGDSGESVSPRQEQGQWLQCIMFERAFRSV